MFDPRFEKEARFQAAGKELINRKLESLVAKQETPKAVASPLPRQVPWSLFRSCLSMDCGLPCAKVRSAPAIVFSRPAQRCRVKKWRRRDCRSSLAGALRCL